MTTATNRPNYWQAGDWTTTGRLVESFGVSDDKGREFGANVTLRASSGGAFCFYPQATRGGKSYGACQAPQTFASETERDAAVAKYLAGARKRAEKNKARAQ